VSTTASKCSRSASARVCRAVRRGRAT
jgi:hypothetical protein